MVKTLQRIHFSFSAPVYHPETREHHPRLRIQTNVVEVQSDEETFSEIRTYLNVFIIGVESRNRFKEMVSKPLHESPPIKSFDSEIERLRLKIDQAREENDKFLANVNEDFRVQLLRYKEEQSIFTERKKPRKNKEIRRDARREGRIENLRESLNEMLYINSTSLPHPIKASDKPAEKSDLISIYELEGPLEAFTRIRNKKIFEIQNNPALVNATIFRQLFDDLNEEEIRIATEDLPKLTVNGYCSIYELEEETGEKFNVRVDGQGLPLDANEQPIAVQMRVIRYAIEHGTSIYDDDGSWAFCPKASDGLTEEQKMIIGSIKDGRSHLVILGPHAVKTILLFAEQWERSDIYRMLLSSGTNQAESVKIGTIDEVPANGERLPRFESIPDTDDDSS
jgi:hypothetical protein